LRDDPENPVFLQTVTGKGYRFIAAVVEDGVPRIEQDSAGNPEPKTHADSAISEHRIENPVRPAATTALAQLSSAQSSWKLRWMVPLAVLVVLVAAGIYGLRVRARSQSAAAQRRVMLAVLPFANLSNDPEQEYFSDGLTEETITDLGELNPERLGVIARTSATAYKHTNKTITQIGHELGVDYVLRAASGVRAGWHASALN
jgi:hypothetical protein